MVPIAIYATPYTIIAQKFYHGRRVLRIRAHRVVLLQLVTRALLSAVTCLRGVKLFRANAMSDSVARVLGYTDAPLFIGVPFSLNRAGDTVELVLNLWIAQYCWHGKDDGHRDYLGLNCMNATIFVRIDREMWAWAVWVAAQAAVGGEAPPPPRQPGCAP